MKRKGSWGGKEGRKKRRERGRQKGERERKEGIWGGRIQVPVGSGTK